MTRSIHDNFVLGYSVDVERASIVIRTEFRDAGEPFERTDVRFEGVIGYMLRDNLGGILFDIQEVSFRSVLQEYAQDFQWGSRYGWPWISARPDLDPEEYVVSKGARAYSIHSAAGFDGFVIARSMMVEAIEEPDATER